MKPRAYLEELLSEGARKLLQTAIENEVTGVPGNTSRTIPPVIVIHNPRSGVFMDRMAYNLRGQGIAFSGLGVAVSCGPK
jgi:hypothetical protein